ncbi:phosphatase PAP2 family protein [Demequina sediminicola]|uniref:phosphatase PAP2 family protein n=1 Tax=Demequina sediminicola TaxID=1095026 RepID=UPI000AF9CFEE|nr:phosphatase PAP2 family protein [Demequina sediminicola]
MIGPGPGDVAPTRAQMGRGLVRRILLPSAVLWVVVVGVGFTLVDLIGIDESAISESAVDMRTESLNTITAVVSELGNTQVLMGTCLVLVGIIWALSRQWWLAVIPAIALAVEAAVFLTASLVVGRPRPEVDQLDHAPPTSSFPSGHTGASTAVYLAVALCATRIRTTWLRITVQVLCVLIPLGVGLSRVYRGMHHPTDVIAGFLVGATCALIAWNWIPLRESAERVANASQQQPAAA